MRKTLFCILAALLLLLAGCSSQEEGPVLPSRNVVLPTLDPDKPRQAGPASPDPTVAPHYTDPVIPSDLTPIGPGPDVPTPSATIPWPTEPLIRPTLPIGSDPTMPILPDPTKPPETEPPETKPTETQPDPIRPAETQPRPTLSPGTQPWPTFSPVTEPPETKPPETQPQPTQPRPTLPQPTQPSETQPKPPETQPVPTNPTPTEPTPTQPTPTQPTVSPPDAPPSPTEPRPVEPTTVTEPPRDPNGPASKDLALLYVGQYNGPFYEDGTDDEVEGVAALLVENPDERHLQYAELYLTIDGKQAVFKVSDLPPGERVLVLEANRMQIRPEPDARFLPAKSTAIYEDPEDHPEISFSSEPGKLTVTNDGRTTVNSVDVSFKLRRDKETLLGGIAFHIRFGRLAPGDSQTLTAPHFDPENCTIVLIKVN